MEDPKKDQIVINNFFDNENRILKELIYDEGTKNVKNLGKILIEELEEKYIDKKTKKEKTKKYHKELTINQLRKYYDSFLKIYYSKIPEETKKIQLLMLKANAEYSAERNDHRRFAVFMNNRINLVLKQSGENFQRYLDAFKMHFEALVGYYPRKQEN